MRDILAIVLAGGRGERLHGLTDRRAKPVVPFAGTLSMIDFPLSNCLNSGIRRMAVATQYGAHDLIHHVQRTWSFLRPELSEFVELWPAQQRGRNKDWYAGTADAVFQNLDLIARHQPSHVLILAGDHVYKQDFSALMRTHMEKGADVTVSCVEVPREDSRRFGIMGIDEAARVTSFHEKPSVLPGPPQEFYLASMGIYLFKTEVLWNVLRADARNFNSAHDFGGDIIPSLIADYNVVAHTFGDGDRGTYWRDVGTLDAYWQSNMDQLCAPEVLNLHDPSWPILTRPEFAPPPRFLSSSEEEYARVANSIVAGGCTIDGANIRQSILCGSVQVERGARISESVILPGAVIGAGARLHRCIVADNCLIPANLVVGEDEGEDARMFHRTSGGVVVITSAMFTRLPAPSVAEPTRLSKDVVPRRKQQRLHDVA